MAYSIFITPDNGQTEVEVIVPDDSLSPLVSVGDDVIEFEALTDAIEIQDEISNPDWWQNAIGLNRYITPDFNFATITPSVAFTLRSLLRFFNIGIRLKKFNDFSSSDNLVEISLVIQTAARFMEVIRPTFAQFAFLGDIAFTEGAGVPDNFGLTDINLGLQVKRVMHQTIADNAVNQFFPPDEHQAGALFGTNFNNYATSANGAVPYNLDDDNLGIYDKLLTLSVKYPGSGGAFVLDSNASFLVFKAGRFADTHPPIFRIDPAPGEYDEPFFAKISINEAGQILYTLDGSTPSFVNGVVPQTGFRLLDKIFIPSGVTSLKLLARDTVGNVTTVLSVTYDVIPRIDETIPSPAPRLDSGVGVVKERYSRNVVLSNEDPLVDVFYTTDGSDPSDIAFADVARLNGLRLVWAGPTALKISDFKTPIDFIRGRGTINLDGEKSFAIATRPFRRYFAYVERVREGRWQTNFKSFNDTPAPLVNTDARILVGFAMTNSFGEFTPESVTNAVDAKAPLQLVKDAGLDGTQTGGQIRLNEEHPIPIISDGDSKDLRYFTVNEKGQFDPTKHFRYTFDTVAPKTRIETSITNSPFPKTLRINIVSDDPNATIYWSKDTTAPQPVLFGQPAKLITGLTFLNTTNPTPNKVRPSRTAQTILFSRIDSLGQRVNITSTNDLKNGADLTIPNSPTNSFFDITVAPDFQFPTKWKLELGDANIPVVEKTDRILVSRAETDNSGILDLSTSKGVLRNAVLAAFLPTQDVTNLSKKFVEPISIDISSPNYLIIFSWFAVDADGNAERTQKAVFKPA